MNESLALRETAQPVALSSDQLAFISRTEFVPQGLRGNLPAILACVTTGRELGLGDMTSLRSIHIIDGKATFSAELMVQLVRKAGHSITGDVSAEKANVTGTRADNGDTMSVEWTLTMAERAGLIGKSNWKKYPETMLWARAVSQLCRMLFADCFAGASYTPEELGAGDVTADELQDERPSVDIEVTPSEIELALAEDIEIAALDTRGDTAPVEPSGSEDPGAAPFTRGVSLLGSHIIPDGVHAGKTLHEVAQSDQGIGWLAKRLKMLGPDDDFRAPLEAYVEAEQPTLWDGYRLWRETQ